MIIMQTKAYILIEVNIGKTKEVVKALNKITNINFVDSVTGPYDIIAIITAKNFEDIGRIITDKIHTIPGMIRTVTCLAVPMSE